VGVTLFIIGGAVFIGLLAAAASWEQKRRGPRSDDHREMYGGTKDDSGWSDPSAGT
jgi:hypothetical protein